MLSMDDLLDYCDLDRDEIAAVAEHEHIPLAVAAELGECLLASPDGLVQLHRMVLDNMEHATERGNRMHFCELTRTYLHLQNTHPLPEVRLRLV